MKFLKGFYSNVAHMIFTSKFSKGHNSVKSIGGVTVLIFCIFLIMFYICTKFCEISQRVSELMRGVNFHTEIHKEA